MLDRYRRRNLSFLTLGAGISGGSPLLNNLLSYWTLTTNSQDVYGSIDGTDTNITYSGAAVFNGTSYISFPDIPAIDSVSKFTINGKIKVTDLSTTRDFFSKWYYPTNGSWLIRCYANGSIEAYIADAVDDTADNYVRAAAGTITVNTEYTIGLVFDGTQTGNTNRCKIYVNGVNVTLNGGGTIPPTTTTGNYNVLFGLLGAAGNPLIGTEREVGLWNTALNAAQMLELTTKNYPFN